MRAGTEGCDRAGLAGLGEHCRALSWRILQVGQISWAEELSPEVRRHYPCSSLLTQATDTQPPLILIPVLIPLPALAHVFSLLLCPPHCSFLSAPSQGSQAAGRAHPLSPLEAREWIPSLPEEQRGLKLGPISPAREPEVSGMGEQGYRMHLERHLSSSCPSHFLSLEPLPGLLPLRCLQVPKKKPQVHLLAKATARWALSMWPAAHPAPSGPSSGT